MKKIIYAYGDLETTKPKLPKGYKTYNDYYKDYHKKGLTPDYPLIYSWMIIYENDKSVLKENENYKVIDKMGLKIHCHYGIDNASLVRFFNNVNADLKVYYNNSKGFDGHFIIPALDDNGYNKVFPLEKEEYLNYDERIRPLMLDVRLARINMIMSMLMKSKKNKDLTDKQLAVLVKKHWNTLYQNEYSEITNKNSQIYQITLASKSTYWSQGIKKFRKIQIRDNLLIFGSSIKKIGNELSKYYQKKYSWNKDEADKMFQKKSIAYDREIGYKTVQEFENDGQEFEYLFQDVFILLMWHKMLEQYYPRKYWKMTAGSTAYTEWQREFGTSKVAKLIELGEAEYIEVANGGYKILYKNKLYTERQLGTKLISELLPTKWLSEPTDTYDTKFQEIYNWFFGGISGVNEVHRGQLRCVDIYDINSSYSKQMSKTALAPYGRGVMGDKEGYDFKLYEIYIKSDIVNLEGMPFLFNIFDKKRQYRKRLTEGMIVRTTTHGLERFYKYYQSVDPSLDLRECVNIVVKYSFQAIPIYKLFDMFIEKWYGLKLEADADGNAPLKAIAKIFLNSLFGKFGSKIIRESKEWIPFTSEWKAVEEELEPQYYLPLAICITELARLDLVDAVGYEYKNVVYCDTDSLFVIHGTKLNIELHNSKLGAWKCEGVKLWGVARRSKQYYYVDMETGYKKVAFAGINFQNEVLPDDELEHWEANKQLIESLRMDEFLKGIDIPIQLQPHRIVGKGILFESLSKRIKPVWDYKPLAEQIYIEEVDYQKALKDVDLFYQNWYNTNNTIRV